ncbi:MAG: hypothetical protein LBL86_03005, partial [Coriobacteriales bacterium]|nr:hypothetical protein [Coriobacteriales bacterium]
MRESVIDPESPNGSSGIRLGRHEGSARRLRPLGALLVVVVPLYFVHTVWFQLITFGTVFSSALLPGVTVEQTMVHVAALAGCLFLVVFGRAARRYNRALVPAMTTSVLLGATFLMLSAHQSLIDQRAMAALGAVLTGLGYAWLFLSMFRLFRNNGTMWELVLVLVLSNAAASIAIGALLACMPDDVLYGTVLVCMLFNGGLLWKAQNAVG